MRAADPPPLRPIVTEVASKLLLTTTDVLYKSGKCSRIPPDSTTNIIYKSPELPLIQLLI